SIPAVLWMRRCVNIWRSGAGGFNGIFRSLVSRGACRGRYSRVGAPAQAPQNRPEAFSVADVLRTARAKLGEAPAARLFAAVRAAHVDDRPARAAVREPFHPALCGRG